MVQGKRYAVFSIRTTKKGESIWIRSGYAYVQADDSMNLYLDVLPIDGHLHVRETGQKHHHQSSTNVTNTNTSNTSNTTPKPEAPEPSPAYEASQSMGGH